MNRITILKKCLIVLLVCVLLQNTMNINAAEYTQVDDTVTENEENEVIGITPFNTYTKVTSLSLSGSGNTANCTTSIVGYSNVTKVSIYMYLQKSVSGSWVTQTSWNGSASSYSMVLSKSATVSSGTYRLKASFYANSENIVMYSSSKTF